MAVISLIEMLKAEPNPVISGVVENVITYDQLSGVLPFQSLSQGSLSYKRELTLPTVSTPSSGATITEDGTLAYDEVTTYVRRFVVDQSIDNLYAMAVGGQVTARANAIAAASKSLSRKYGTDVINGNAGWTATANSFGGTGYTAATIVVGPGHDSRSPVGLLRYTHSGTTVAYKAPGDAAFGTAVTYSAGVRVASSNPNKWITVNFTAGTAAANGDVTFTITPTSSSTPIDGLVRLVAASQVISSSGTNGDAISLAALDQLTDSVKVVGPRAIVCHSRTRRAIVALLRASGGVTMMELAREFAPSMRSAMTVPSYNGIPLLASDWLPTNRAKGSLSTGTMVFCAALGPGGVTGTFCATERDPSENDIIAQGAAGLTVINLGNQSSTDSKKVRVRAYWGVKLDSDLGLAALDEITN